MFKANINSKEDSTLLVKNINNEYKNINNPYDLYNASLNIWSKDTCAPRMRDRWSNDNPTVGQCSITAFLAQDIFGGEVYGVALGDGNYHCFNVVGDAIFDLTSEQFNNKDLDYSLNYKQDRSTHFKKKEKEERYNLLKSKLYDYLNK